MRNINKIDLIHGLPESSPSVKNLLQGLNALDNKWKVREHQLRPDLSGSNILSSGGELAVYQINLLKKYVSLRCRNDIDIIIIHKPFTDFIFDMCFSTTIAEQLFQSFDSVVYTTYDATYINHRNKSEYLFKNSDLIYATSKAIQREALKFVPKHRVSYIPPSVDTDFFNPDKSPPEDLNTNSLVLGWIGNADLHKEDINKISEYLNGIDVDNVTLRFLMGGGTIEPKQRSELEDIASEIDYIQWIPWENVPNIIKSFDVGLAPLADTEFNRARSSEKIREYMACGIPVIASDVGENKHLIPDDGGFVVSSDEEWKEAIKKLSNKQFRNSMGESARNYVINNYSLSAVSEKIDIAFTELLNDREKYEK